MNKVAMTVMTEVLHRLSNTDFHSLRLTKQWPLLSPQSASSKNNTESALPRMICHLSDGRLITLNHFQQFLLTKRDSYSGYRCLSCMQCFCQNYHHPCTNTMPYPLLWLCHRALLLIKKLTSRQMKWGDGPRLTEFTGVITFSTILKEQVW